MVGRAVTTTTAGGPFVGVEHDGTGWRVTYGRREERVAYVELPAYTNRDDALAKAREIVHATGGVITVNSDTTPNPERLCGSHDRTNRRTRN